MEILKQGGNAFDAAVAVSSTLAVVEPSSSGLGGGGFWLLHRASDGFEIMVDAREVAPQAATRDMFLDEKGNVVPGRSTRPRSRPPFPAKLPAGRISRAKYGKLPLKTSLQPAIRLAREGFPLNTRLRGGIEAKKQSVPGRRGGQDLPGERRSAGGRHDHQAAGARADSDDARRAGARRLLQRRGGEAHGRRRAQARRHLVAGGFRELQA